MSFLTYRLNRHLRTVDEGATQAHYGEVEAIIKQDHAEARVQVYSELVANRFAALVGVDVATGALVAHDTELKFASLRLANIAAGATCIETEEQFESASSRYASQCARIAVFDLWIGNEDRVGNLMARIGPDAEYLIVTFDHGRTLLGCIDGVVEAVKYPNETGPAELTPDGRDAGSQPLRSDGSAHSENRREIDLRGL